MCCFSDCAVLSERLLQCSGPLASHNSHLYSCVYLIIPALSRYVVLQLELVDQVAPGDGMAGGRVLSSGLK